MIRKLMELAGIPVPPPRSSRSSRSCEDSDSSSEDSSATSHEEVSDRHADGEGGEGNDGEEWGCDHGEWGYGADEWGYDGEEWYMEKWNNYTWSYHAADAKLSKYEDHGVDVAASSEVATHSRPPAVPVLDMKSVQAQAESEDHVHTPSANGASSSGHACEESSKAPSVLSPGTFIKH